MGSGLTRETSHLFVQNELSPVRTTSARSSSTDPCLLSSPAVSSVTKTQLIHFIDVPNADDDSEKKMQRRSATLNTDSAAGGDNNNNNNNNNNNVGSAKLNNVHSVSREHERQANNRNDEGRKAKQRGKEAEDDTKNNSNGFDSERRSVPLNLSGWFSGVMKSKPRDSLTADKDMMSADTLNGMTFNSLSPLLESMKPLILPEGSKAMNEVDAFIKASAFRDEKAAVLLLPSLHSERGIFTAPEPAAVSPHAFRRTTPPPSRREEKSACLVRDPNILPRSLFCSPPANEKDLLCPLTMHSPKKIPDAVLPSSSDRHVPVSHDNNDDNNSTQQCNKTPHLHLPSVRKEFRTSPLLQLQNYYASHRGGAGTASVGRKSMSENVREQCMGDSLAVGNIKKSPMKENVKQQYTPTQLLQPSINNITNNGNNSVGGGSAEVGMTGVCLCTGTSFLAEDTVSDNKEKEEPNTFSTLRRSRSRVVSFTEVAFVSDPLPSIFPCGSGKECGPPQMVLPSHAVDRAGSDGRTMDDDDDALQGMSGKESTKIINNDTDPELLFSLLGEETSNDKTIMSGSSFSSLTRARGSNNNTAAIITSDVSLMHPVIKTCAPEVHNNNVNSAATGSLSACDHPYHCREGGFASTQGESFDCSLTPISCGLDSYDAARSSSSLRSNWVLLVERPQRENLAKKKRNYRACED